MDSFLLLTLTTTLMFVGGQCFSQSMSCSSINGKMVCERQTSDGNTAGAFAGSMLGPHGATQEASAMTGNTQTGQFQSSRRSLDPQTQFGGPNFFPNQNAGGIPDSGHLPGAGVMPGYGHSSSAAVPVYDHSSGAGVPGYDHSSGAGVPGYGHSSGAGMMPGYGNFHGAGGLPGYGHLSGFGVMPGYGHIFGAGGVPSSDHLFGTGASDAASFDSNANNPGISASGFTGTSNNNGAPGAAFGGFAVADSNGNYFYGTNHAQGGGYGYGNPGGFIPNGFGSNGFNPSDVFSSVGLPNPFDMLGRRRRR